MIIMWLLFFFGLRLNFRRYELFALGVKTLVLLVRYIYNLRVQLEA